jgi:cyclopropane-fatty-acyl-phospholipid synthase
LRALPAILLAPRPAPANVAGCNTRLASGKHAAYTYAHYDIGNALYSAWLDPSMTYSSALFEDGTADLTAAQNDKFRRLAEAIDLQPGRKLLEIGCGWGGFAEYAAKTYGARVVGLTISKEQRDFAQRRIQDVGLGDKVEIRLQDYRDERDQYDHIASIEMIEAVGEQFWPRYFSQLRDRLLPGGLAGIQAITIQDRLFQTYRREVDFIQRYVFPGHAAFAAGPELAWRAVRRTRYPRAHFRTRLCQDACDLAK